MSVGLLTASKAYKPFKYPWAYDFWLAQQRVHWLHEEVPMAEDVKDWRSVLTDQEKNLLTQIFRFFTQADVDVNDNYMDNLAQVFKPNEIKMMMSSFSNMETMHMAAYALLLETVGMPETEFGAFLEYEQMSEKHDYLQGFKMDTEEDIARNIAAFGGFTEGLQLFGSFVMLLNFPRFGKMKGMGQIITWSVRDESIHCEGMVKLFHEFCHETGVMNKRLSDDIRGIAETVVGLEDKFVDLAFEMGGVQGMEAQDIKNYIRYLADWRLGQFNLKPIYGVTQHPIPWAEEMLNGVEHANFFEQRATEYSKGATSGSWGDDVWAKFDALYKEGASLDNMMKKIS